jgi:hypothetical protein
MKRWSSLQFFVRPAAFLFEGRREILDAFVFPGGRANLVAFVFHRGSARLTAFALKALI